MMRGSDLIPVIIVLVLVSGSMTLYIISNADLDQDEEVMDIGPAGPPVPHTVENGDLRMTIGDTRFLQGERRKIDLTIENIGYRFIILMNLHIDLNILDPEPFRGHIWGDIIEDEENGTLIYDHSYDQFTGYLKDFYSYPIIPTGTNYSVTLELKSNEVRPDRSINLEYWIYDPWSDSKNIWFRSNRWYGVEDTYVHLNDFYLWQVTEPERIFARSGQEFNANFMADVNFNITERKFSLEDAMEKLDVVPSNYTYCEQWNMWAFRDQDRILLIDEEDELQLGNTELVTLDKFVSYREVYPFLVRAVIIDYEPSFMELDDRYVEIERDWFGQSYNLNQSDTRDFFILMDEMGFFGYTYFEKFIFVKM